MFKFLNPLWLVENWLTCHWVGAAISIAGAIEGATSSDSANSTAASQGNAGLQAGIDAVNKIGDRTRADTQPYRDLGSGATSKLAYLLGVGGSADGSTAANTSQFTGPLIDTTQGDWRPNAQLYSTSPEYKQAYDKFVAGHQARYGKNPNNAKGSNESEAEQELKTYGFDINAYNQQQQQKQQEALKANALDPVYGSLLSKFNQNDLNNDLVYQNGLQFGLDNGNKALNNHASATGMSDSGQIYKALTQFGNDYATTKTQGAYDRNVQDKSNIYNMLAGGTNVGQRAVSQDATTGSNIATAVAGANAQMGANNAAATLGSNQANLNATNNIANTLGGVNWGQFGSKTGTSGGTSIPIDYSQFGGSF